MRHRSDPPAAIRATASIEPARLLKRPVRKVRYDAYWDDGHIEHDVDHVKLLYRCAPADFQVIDARVHAECPEVGVGKWVDHYGQIVEEPQRRVPNAPAGIGVKRSRHGSSRSVAMPKLHPGWPLGFGTAGLGLGVLLLAGPASDGFVGFIGMLISIFSMSTFVNFFLDRRRR